MRGTLALRVCVVSPPGIIPAYAGNTPIDTGDMLNARDHPRICGEHLYLSAQRKFDPGSSPHMRGTRHVLHARHRLEGIIPAYAGNTRFCLFRRVLLRDHPRICGEHKFCHALIVHAPGSSPHMRGTPEAGNLISTSKGIIPAYAGNTKEYLGDDVYGRDHPRICGEHFNAVRNATSPQGSSPHMRGTRVLHHFVFGRVGIIPAYAGNTRQYCPT